MDPKLIKPEVVRVRFLLKLLEPEKSLSIVMFPVPASKIVVVPATTTFPVYFWLLLLRIVFALVLKVIVPVPVVLIVTAESELVPPKTSLKLIGPFTVVRERDRVTELLAELILPVKLMEPEPKVLAFKD